MSTNERNLFKWLLIVYAWLLAKAFDIEMPDTTQGEIKIKMNYIVKDNNPSVDFQLELGEVKDAEGNVIDSPALDITIQSSNPDALAVTVNEDGKSGTVAFGNPGVSGFTVEVKDKASGKLLGSGGDTFTVTTGDPDSITSVATSFTGLTPVDESGDGGTGDGDSTGEGAIV